MVRKINVKMIEPREKTMTVSKSTKKCNSGSQKSL